jgi:two-component system LytT family response regulator
MTERIITERTSGGSAGPWRAVVVDDEPPARHTLRLLLAREKDFTLVAECGHGEEAVAAVAREQPDVLFLDVRMPGMDGFEVLRRIGGDALPAVVFVTAYDQYAPQAFERHAVEYLLKPFSDERFSDVVDHVRRRLRERSYAALAARLPVALAENAARQDRRRLVVRDGARTHVIPHEDIIWIEAEDYYARIHAPGPSTPLGAGPSTSLGAGRSVLARESLRTLEKTLDPAMFVRVHRSAIVNTAWIKAVEPLASGDQKLVLSDGTTLRVSRTHRAALMRKLE